MTLDGSEPISAANLKAALQPGGGVLLSAYPVGSIYMSVSSTDPGTLFGGTWERIQDVFLLAAGSAYAAGSTGGEASHKLTVSEMPSHSHSFDTYSGGGAMGKVCGSEELNTKRTVTTKATGGGGAHNNMPPYLAVYVWKRVE